MTALAAVRDTIAEALHATIPDDALGDIAVFAAPVDAITAPGYLVEWADPMLVAKGFCLYDARVVVRVIGPRIDAEGGTVVVENLLAPALDALADIGMVSVDVAAPAPWEVGGLTFLASRVTVATPVAVDAVAAPPAGVPGPPTLAHIRDTIADALRATIPADDLGDVAVVSAPVDAMTAPGYLVEWGDPMLAARGFCTYDARVVVRVVGPRIDADNGTAIVETLLAPALGALGGVGWGVADVAAPAPFDIGGLAFLAARVTATATVNVVAAAAVIDGAAVFVATATLTVAGAVIATATITGAATLHAAPALTATGTVLAAAVIDGAAVMHATPALAVAGTVVPAAAVIDGAATFHATPALTATGTVLPTATIDGAATLHAAPALAVAGTVLPTATVDGAATFHAVPALAAAGTVIAVWTPTALPSLQLWYDADDAATITASAGLVSQWNDKAAGARHVTATAALRPTTGTRTINGRNALDFSGSNYLTSPSFTRGQPSTLILVIQTDVVNAAQHLAFRSADATISVSAGIEATNQWRFSNGTTITGGTPNTSAHVLVALSNGATSQLWLDGVSIAGPTPGGLNTITGGIRIGANNAGGGTWDGLIAEVILDGTALSTTDRQSAEAYLRAKWATP